jgi:hypothetical protein
MTASLEPHWISAVEEGDWIIDALDPWNTTVASVVPRGFEAYARILHPVETPEDGQRLIRWSEVARWAGNEQKRNDTFPGVALAPGPAVESIPWSGEGPEEGVLYTADAVAMASHLRLATSTPDRCLFCLWDLYSAPRNDYRGYLLSPLPTAEDIGESPPIPKEVIDGVRVDFPSRRCFLFEGPVEDGFQTAATTRDMATPMYWWPDDHAWCVATEADFSWTYVGGSHEVIDHLLSDPRLEAELALPNDPIARMRNSWLKSLSAEGADTILRDGKWSVELNLGTIEVMLRRPSDSSGGEIRLTARRLDRSGTLALPPRKTAEDGLRDEVCDWIGSALVALAH